MITSGAQRFLKKILPFTLFVVAACGDATIPVHGVESSSQAVNQYQTSPNGTGIHVGSTQPESWFGLTNLTLSWYMTGFSQHTDGTWWATGWYSLSAGVLSADAQLIGAQLSGVSLQVQAIRTSGSQLGIDLRDALGNVQTLQGAALVGLRLKLRVPDQLGLTYTNYWLRLDSAESLDSQFNDVAGYQVNYLQEGLLGGTWSSYCLGANGESQRAVFYQGSQWHPMNAARTDGANLVTMTCETGSVAKCMRWGYRPWGSSQQQSGVTGSLVDLHQACIHMKRASYCGDSQAHTIDGTQIYIIDSLNPQIHSGPLDVLEALWTTTGATCVSNRRHPEIPFVGCPLPLPTCSSPPSSGYLLADSLPPAGSLLGLPD